MSKTLLDQCPDAGALAGGDFPGLIEQGVGNFYGGFHMGTHTFNYGHPYILPPDCREVKTTTAGGCGNGTQIGALLL